MALFAKYNVTKLKYLFVDSSDSQEEDRVKNLMEALPKEIRKEIEKKWIIVIAEEDLKQRGPGDFLRGSGEESVRQSGGIKFRLAELCDDAGLMNSAFEEARALLATSPDLSEYPLLLSHVEKMFTLERGTVN